MPLWRGNHVAIKQLVEDFARYLYLPRLADSKVLTNAIGDGLSLITWQVETFAYADGLDEAVVRYRGLRGGQRVNVSEDSSGLLVKPDVARLQLDADTPTGPPGDGPIVPDPKRDPLVPPPEAQIRRFHGTANLDPLRVGLDASRIAQEVIAHLTGLVGTKVTVTLEIAADLPNGASDQVVRTVTENSRTLKFTSQGFEKE